MRSKASSVITSPRHARAAASESALPASVPPTPPTSESSSSIVRLIPSATSWVNP